MGQITSKVGVKNISEEDINPSTEEKQDSIITSVGNLDKATGYTSASSYTLTAGSVSSGDIESTKHKDNTYLIIDEDVSNGITIEFDYVLEKNEKPRKILFCGKYDGGSGHRINLYIYDQSNLSWVNLNNILNKNINPSDNYIHIEWDFDNPDFVDSSGNVKIKLQHNTATYNSSHSLHIDHLALGDYKSQELLARIKDEVIDLQEITDRGYMKFTAEDKKIKYDIPDPRIKDADINKVKIYADMTDDADFKAARIPIVSSFNDISTGNYILDRALYKKYRFMTGIDSYTDTIHMQRLHFLVEMDNKKLLDLVFIPSIVSGGSHEVLYRFLQENATSKDFNNVPSIYQKINTDTNYLDVDDLTKINWAYAISVGDKINILYEYYNKTTLSYKRSNFIITIDEQSGISLINKGASGDIGSSSRKSLSLTKLRNNNFCVTVKESNSTNYIAIFEYDYNNKNVSSNLLSITGYINNGGVAIANDYSSLDEKDVLVALFETWDEISVYKINLDTGVQSKFKTLSYSNEVDNSPNYNFWMYSRPNGEIVISVVDDSDGYRDYYYSTDYGNNWTFDEDGFWTSRDEPHFSSDKVYYDFSDSEQGSTSATYRISPIDKSTFIEAKIDFDDLIIEFSKSPVSGTIFYITEYKKRDVILQNKTTFDADGKPIINPLVIEVQKSNKSLDINNPLPVSGTDVYDTDVDVNNSDIGDFTGDITDLFNDLHSQFTSSTSANPKTFDLKLKRPIKNKAIGIVTDTGSFSNVKIELYDAYGTLLETIDDSADGTAQTSKVYHSVNVDEWCHAKIRFYTANTITLSYLCIYRAYTVFSKTLDNNGNDVFGEVQATPTANTILGRLSSFDFDSVSGGLNVIDSIHDHIHDGIAYIHRKFHSILKGASYDHLIYVPTGTIAHMIIGVEGVSSSIEVSLYESTIITQGGEGTLMNIKNRNRGSADSNAVLIYGQPTITSVGTLLADNVFGAGRNSAGGGNRDENEMVLTAGYYLLRVTERNIQDTDVNFVFDWYEK